MRPWGVIRKPNSSGTVVPRTPEILAPSFEKLLNMQGRADLPSWIVAGECHSTRKHLRRSRLISRVLQTPF